MLHKTNNILTESKTRLRKRFYPYVIYQFGHRRLTIAISDIFVISNSLRLEPYLLPEIGQNDSLNSISSVLLLFINFFN